MDVTCTAHKLLSLLFFSAVASINAHAATIHFSGSLDIIELDRGGAVYSGVALGTSFSGLIDDITFAGSISDGTTQTDFGCCIAAGGLGVSNDTLVTAEDAALLNSLAGSDIFSTGDLIDGVDIEGDAATAGGGRIEIGVSYIFDGATFDDASLGNYPFDPNDVMLALFFITEENSLGRTSYAAVGALHPVPLPATAWLLGSGLLALFARARASRKT